MKNQKVSPLKGSLSVPGDKSISHRAVMFGALAEGRTEVSNFLQGEDCLSTIRCFRQLGIRIENNPLLDRVTVHGKGLHGLTKATDTLDVGNSGTTMRLMSGILSGQTFASTLTGDASIRKRPMGRIMIPLKEMGADIISEPGNGCAPLLINQENRRSTDVPNHSYDSSFLTGIHYVSPIASAQIKSCVLLAGLYAKGETCFTEPYLSRNHTELMLAEFGAEVRSEGSTAILQPEPNLMGISITVPGDISSAAYFIAAALIVPNSELLIRNVGINPTRDGILRVCKQMGADISFQKVSNHGGEPVADILVRHSELHGIEIGGSIIPTLIDEIPVIAVLACFAKGKTIIRDAAELKVKESNRLDVMVNNLTQMGADIVATEDGMIIEGGKPLQGAVIDSKLDHRIAMSFAVADLMSEGAVTILNPECVTISYPGFYADLKRLQNK